MLSEFIRASGVEEWKVKWWNHHVVNPLPQVCGGQSMWYLPLGVVGNDKSIRWVLEFDVVENDHYVSEW